MIEYHINGKWYALTSGELVNTDSEMIWVKGDGETFLAQKSKIKGVRRTPKLKGRWNERLKLCCSYHRADVPPDGVQH